MIDIRGKYFMVILDQIVEFEVERKEGKDFLFTTKNLVIIEWMETNYLKIGSLLMKRHIRRL